MSWRFRVTPVLFLAAATPAAAQLIPIRTIPVFQSQQFDFFPSLTLGMGGVSLAVEDSLLDPFSNPAKGGRIGGARFFVAPGVYRVERGAGAARTLPFGIVARSGTWFGGLAVAMQGLDMGERFEAERVFPCPGCPGRGLDPTRPDRTHGNRYALAMLGNVFPGTGVSIGGSVSWAGLNGIQGVDQLYLGSVRIKPDGHALDLRIGALKQWDEGRALTALLVHNRFGVTHDVLFLDQTWDTTARVLNQRGRIEENVERSRTWGLHLEYVYPLEGRGWRLGWIATTNLKSHPKIPTYVIPDIQSVPRDPGHSEAFNLGVGLSKTSGGSTLGADLIYEPIWSHTWADSEQPVGTAAAGTILPGGKTVENWFRFTNAVVRMGFSHEFPYDEARAVNIRLGLSAHSINYSLAQQDHIQGRARDAHQGWVEWTPTWGLSFRFTGLEIHYRGSVTGTEIARLGGGDDVTLTEPGGGGNILAPINGQLLLRALRVVTHQISIAVPIR